MKLILALQESTRVVVTCDGQPSHSFDLDTLIPGKNGLPQPLDDPVLYGRALYQALFAAETPAGKALSEMPERILLVPLDDALDAVPWEYVYGPDDFLVLDYHFVRGFPVEQPAPLLDNSLHIVAVPSNPLAKELVPLNIDGEWMRLKESIQQVPYAISLERTRPPTSEQLRNLIAGQRYPIVHFMGHGDQHTQAGAFLCFEKENGALDPVTSRQLAQRVRDAAFLVTLNACVSAAPGETKFSNLAATLVRQKVPYALGMRFTINDEDALAFSHTFYNNLARGVPIEEALRQARLTLAGKSSRAWAVGVPVLYTSLSTPAAGFVGEAGKPVVEDYQPNIEANALPRALGTFQGRIDELQQLGSYLTGDNRPRLITIHGDGGQGKTALAREVIERFAYAWPGGVWATTLEHLPSRAIFVNALARFLGLALTEGTSAAEVEQLVMNRLSQQRTLIVLDNAETLIEAVIVNDKAAGDLASCIRACLSVPTVGLLTISRTFLNWDGEVGLERDLEGLAPKEGARLFRQAAPRRLNDIDLATAEAVSDKVGGHPLSLRLLAGAFNNSTISLADFIRDCETYLLRAEDKFAGEGRHRTLYACIEASVRYLDDDLRTLLSRLALFQAPFLPAVAVAIFDAEGEESGEGQQKRSPIYDRLNALAQRSLLVHEDVTLREGRQRFYRLLPTVHTYIETYLAKAEEREHWLARFGSAYADLVGRLCDEINRGSTAAYVALRCRTDIERGIEQVAGVAQGYYQLYWGKILRRVGDTAASLLFTENALGIGQEEDQTLAVSAMNNLASTYWLIGQAQTAKEFYEQALSLAREVGDRSVEAAVLQGLAAAYQRLEQFEKAMELYEEALPLLHAAGDWAAEAVTLNNLGELYRETQQFEKAQQKYEQSLPLAREAGDRSVEASILNNQGLLYEVREEWQKAKELYEQALPIRQEVRDRAGEATTYANLGKIYKQLEQMQKAEDEYKRALSLMKQVGNRLGEAQVLNNLAYLFMELKRYDEAQAYFEQSIALAQSIPFPPVEAGGLVSLGALLYEFFHRPLEAAEKMEQAITILEKNNLSKASGMTFDQLRQLAGSLRHEALGPAADFASIPAEELQFIMNNTVSVMTTMQERWAEWRGVVAGAVQKAQQRDLQIDVQFFTAILALLDGQTPVLPEGHPYLTALTEIQQQIAAFQTQIAAQQLLFDDGLITRSVIAIVGGPEQKTAYAQYLTVLSMRTQDDGLKVLFQALQQALTGDDLAQIGRGLKGIYREAWESIVLGVETGGVDPGLLVRIMSNTRAVLGPMVAQRGAWREELKDIKEQAAKVGASDLVKLLDVVIALLDAGGRADGLGTNLTGVYARMWRAIVETA